MCYELYRAVRYKMHWYVQNCTRKCTTVSAVYSQFNEWCWPVIYKRMSKPLNEIFTFCDYLRPFCLSSSDYLKPFTCKRFLCAEYKTFIRSLYPWLYAGKYYWPHRIHIDEYSTLHKWQWDYAVSYLLYVNLNCRFSIIVWLTCWPRANYMHKSTNQHDSPPEGIPVKQTKWKKMWWGIYASTYLTMNTWMSYSVTRYHVFSCI